MVRGRKNRAATATASSRTLEDDKCCASPKRKDCKLDNNNHNGMSTRTHDQKLYKKEESAIHLNSDYNCRNHAKNRSSKITNYFHIDQMKSKKNVFDVNATIKHRHKSFNLIELHGGGTDITNDIIDNDDEDENTDSSLSSSSNKNLPYQIESIINDPNTNIFLQAPVLHLNIDKSPNQPSSIIINKNIDLTTLTTASGLVTSFPNNKHININNTNGLIHSDITERRIHFMCDKVLRSQRAQTTESEESSISSDTNSCDSGVVVDKSIEISPSKRRKPTTPHRILCPSPVKHIPGSDNGAQIVAISDSDIAITNEKSPTSQLSNLMICTKKNSKSRRRLIVNHRENKDIDNDALIPAIGTENNKKQFVETLPIEYNTKNHILNIVADPTAKQNTNNNAIINNGNPTNNNCSKNTKLKDFFPVRRSVRKTKKAVEQEQLWNIEAAIRNQQEDGLLVKKFPTKGRGVVTTRRFVKGDFVVEYIGDLIDMHEANEREQTYAQDENTGCYMYYFKHKNQQYCIDATPESGKLGRLVNHSRNGNLITRTVFYRNRPHLVLIAKDDIDAGDELTYDYGDRSREALQHHPWLAL